METNIPAATKNDHNEEKETEQSIDRLKQTPTLSCHVEDKHQKHSSSHCNDSFKDGKNSMRISFKADCLLLNIKKTSSVDSCVGHCEALQKKLAKKTEEPEDGNSDGRLECNNVTQHKKQENNQACSMEPKTSQMSLKSSKRRSMNDEHVVLKYQLKYDTIPDSTTRSIKITSQTGNPQKISMTSPDEFDESSFLNVDDKPGRRKRKPSRYHDSMFDIPTKLMNINRIVTPEEFKAFHHRSSRGKEKRRRASPVENMKKSTDVSDPSQTRTSLYPDASYNITDDNDLLDKNNIFKFKMGKEHVVHNSGGSPTSYRCDICMMMFPRSFSLRRHYVRRHINPRFVQSKPNSVNVAQKSINDEAATDQSSPSSGSQTGNGINQLEKLSNHKAIANDGIKKESNFLYACKLCSKNLVYFKHKKELKSHCMEKHSTTSSYRSISVFECDLCHRSYSTRHELERHARTHSGERPYPCQFCKKTFPTSTNARRHERTHTGDRPHICKVCDKGFIQRTDMVKHLKAVHKMKVTKTKAERASSVKSKVQGQVKNTMQECQVKGEEKPSAKSSIGTDNSNEFQENIDFAAYLKLDQHGSGTLMGEKIGTSSEDLIPQSSSKKQLNNSNNQHTKNNMTTSDSKLELPRKESIGNDGRPERSHCCPDCPKMFTSNINLRRHYKLKHERMQLFQSAEPVSMVVEKYKIKDENVVEGTGINTVKTNSLGLQKECKSTEDVVEVNELLDAVNSSGEKKSLLPEVQICCTISEADHNMEKDTKKTLETQRNENGERKSSSYDMCTIGSKSKRKHRGESKLNSIVKRLCDKRSSQVSASSGCGISDEEDSKHVKSSDSQPISKLKEMEQLLKNYFPTDTTPLKNKRKSLNVQHLPSSVIHEDMPTRTRMSSHSDSKLKQVVNVLQSPHLSRKNVILGHVHSACNLHDAPISFENENFSEIQQQRKSHPTPQNSIPIGNHSVLEEEHFMRQKSDIYQRYTTPIIHHDDHQNNYHNISNSFAPLTTRPFSFKRDNTISCEGTHTMKAVSTRCQTSSRFQTFLSQCWTSKRHNIPQNATLNIHRNVSDSSTMFHRKLYTYDSNSHKKAKLSSTFCSTQTRPFPNNNLHMRDQLQGEKIDIFHCHTGHSDHEQYSLHSYTTNKVQNPQVKELVQGDNDDSDSSPLDLRLPCKKNIPDYMVRDDGVLDFSRKTNKSLMHPMHQKIPVNAHNVGNKHVPSHTSSIADRFSILKDCNENLRVASKSPMQCMELGVEAYPPLPLGQNCFSASSNPTKISNRRRSVLYGNCPIQGIRPYPTNFEGSKHTRPLSSHTLHKFHDKRMVSSKMFQNRPYVPRIMNFATRSSSKQKRGLCSPPWRNMSPRTFQYNLNGTPFQRHSRQQGRPSSQTGSQCVLCNSPEQRFINSWGSRPTSNFERFLNTPKIEGFNDHHRYPQMYLHGPNGERSGAKNCFMASPNDIVMVNKQSKRPALDLCKPNILEYSESEMMTRCIQKAQKALKVGVSNTDLGESQDNMLILPDPAPVFRPTVLSLTSIAHGNSSEIAAKLPVIVNIPSNTANKPHALCTTASEISPSIQPMIQTTAEPHLSRLFEIPSEISLSHLEPSTLSSGDVAETGPKPFLLPSFDIVEGKSGMNEVSEAQVEYNSSRNALVQEINNQLPLVTEHEYPETMLKNGAPDNSSFLEDSCLPLSTIAPTKINSLNEDNSPPEVEGDIGHGPDLLDGFNIVDVIELKLDEKGEKQHHFSTSINCDNLSAQVGKTERTHLKRSASSDSSQADVLSDESDGTQKKLKLKLRVIKSPGSEHKQYWTLVDQDISTVIPKNEMHENNSKGNKDSTTAPKMDMYNRYCPYCKLPLKNQRIYTNHTSHCVGRIVPSTDSAKENKQAHSRLEDELICNAELQQVSKSNDQAEDSEAVIDHMDDNNNEELINPEAKQERKKVQQKIKHRVRTANKPHPGVMVQTKSSCLHSISNKDAMIALEALEISVREDTSDLREFQGMNQIEIKVEPGTDKIQEVECSGTNAEEKNLSQYPSLVTTGNSSNLLPINTEMNIFDRMKVLSMKKEGRNKLIAEVEVPLAKISNKKTEINYPYLRDGRYINIPTVLLPDRSETTSTEDNGDAVKHYAEKEADCGEEKLNKKTKVKECMGTIVADIPGDDSAELSSKFAAKCIKTENELSELESVGLEIPSATTGNTESGKVGKKHILIRKHDSMAPSYNTQYRLRRSVRRRLRSSEKELLLRKK